DFGGVQPVFAAAPAGAGAAMAAAPAGAGATVAAMAAGTLTLAGRQSTVSNRAAGGAEAEAAVTMSRAGRWFGRVAVGLTLAGVLSLGTGLVLRASNSGHIPYMSLYEICLMFAFGIS